MEQQFQKQNNEQMQREFDQQQPKNQFNSQQQNQFNLQQQNQQSKHKKTLLSIIGVAILVIGLIGVTYAFFNYTRTGSANTIRVGRISFNSEQGNAINITNLFPIDVTNGISNDATKVGTVTINVTGDTTYDEGVEYLVSVVNVQNAVGNKKLPISIDVSVANNTTNDPATTLGTSDANYYTNRGGNTSIYKVIADDTIKNNSKLLAGYIAKGATGVDGNIVIKAYLDDSKIAISDTYSETPQYIRNPNMNTTEMNYCIEIASYYAVDNAAAEAFCQGTGQIYDWTLQGYIDTYKEESSWFDQSVFDNFLSANVIKLDTDSYGTTSEWVAGRTVFTTQEWNSLQTSGVSFQVKVEANKGIWTPMPAICRRATVLHTETCDSSSPCYQTGGHDEYNENGTTITYGRLGTEGSLPQTGDAFDCDVNGNGTYDERFYYVSNYYNTKTMTFDNTYATLVYYKNYLNGAANDGGAVYRAGQYEESPWTQGPNYAHMPSTSLWSNVSLKDTRNILAIDSSDLTPSTTVGVTTLPQNYEYTNKAARLLTVQEILSGCELDATNAYDYNSIQTKCEFLLEKTQYNEYSSEKVWTLLLENPNSSVTAYIFNVGVNNMNLLSNSVYDTGGFRPAIDVPINRIEY